MLSCMVARLESPSIPERIGSCCPTATHTASYSLMLLPRLSACPAASASPCLLRYDMQSHSILCPVSGACVPVHLHFFAFPSQECVKHHISISRTSASRLADCLCSGWGMDSWPLRVQKRSWQLLARVQGFPVSRLNDRLECFGALLQTTSFYTCLEPASHTKSGFEAFCVIQTHFGAL